MAKQNEATVEERLRALYNLQLIDSRIDEIKNFRGELPLEIGDLESEVAGLDKRLQKLNADLEAIDHSVTHHKEAIETSKALIEKYSEQQKNVRNNREYNSLTKEIEFQELEIELSEKRIKESKNQKALKKETIVTTNGRLESSKALLKRKSDELGVILADTEKEEQMLLEKSEMYKKQVEARLVAAYERIRKKVKNGLAVVPIQRGASGGSFFTIPPQVQVEIAARKKIIIDEHSGRILVDTQLAEEQKAEMESLFEKLV